MIEADDVDFVRMTNHGPSVWCPGCRYPHVFNAPETPTRDGASWKWNGDMQRPTFDPSMLVKIGHPIEGTGPAWQWDMRTTCHSYLRNGQWQFLDDSVHSLRNQTVNVEPFPFPRSPA